MISEILSRECDANPGAIIQCTQSPVKQKLVRKEHVGRGSSHHLPFAIAFTKERQDGRAIAVADENGYVAIWDTRSSNPVTSSPSGLIGWRAHNNAVFDVCWLKGERHLLTASGDQQIRAWDPEAQRSVSTFRGHVGSPKSLSANWHQPELFVSGGRDGNILLWDTRCPAHGKVSSIRPVSVIRDAHEIAHGSKGRKAKVRAKEDLKRSVTAVHCLKDATLIASAGASDGSLKIWDTRNTSHPAVLTAPPGGTSSVSQNRLYGISSLSQDSCGTRLVAACTDNNIYMYDTLNLELGPRAIFSGHQMGSFFVKAKMNSDGSHIICGSSDAKAYIWEVAEPHRQPIVLEGHDSEVSGVDWCMTDPCLLATCSDDTTVRLWEFERPFLRRREDSRSGRVVLSRRRNPPPKRPLSADQFLPPGAMPIAGPPALQDMGSLSSPVRPALTEEAAAEIPSLAPTSPFSDEPPSPTSPAARQHVPCFAANLACTSETQVELLVACQANSQQATDVSGQLTTRQTQGAVDQRREGTMDGALPIHLGREMGEVLSGPAGPLLSQPSAQPSGPMPGAAAMRPKVGPTFHEAIRCPLSREEPPCVPSSISQVGCQVERLPADTGQRERPADCSNQFCPPRVATPPDLSRQRPQVSEGTSRWSHRRPAVQEHGIDKENVEQLHACGTKSSPREGHRPDALSFDQALDCVADARSRESETVAVMDRRIKSKDVSPKLQRSPLSVLSPLPSSKRRRTIQEYFLPPRVSDGGKSSDS